MQPKENLAAGAGVGGAGVGEAGAGVGAAGEGGAGVGGAGVGGAGAGVGGAGEEVGAASIAQVGKGAVKCALESFFLCNIYGLQDWLSNLLTEVLNF